MYATYPGWQITKQITGSTHFLVCSCDMVRRGLLLSSCSKTGDITVSFQSNQGVLNLAKVSKLYPESLEHSRPTNALQHLRAMNSQRLKYFHERQQIYTNILTHFKRHRHKYITYNKWHQIWRAFLLILQRRDTEKILMIKEWQIKINCINLTLTLRQVKIPFALSLILCFYFFVLQGITY